VQSTRTMSQRTHRQEEAAHNARLTAILTQSGDSYFARCNEVAVEGEGKTPDQAIFSLFEVLLDYFQQEEAVAPPVRAPIEPIELVVSLLDGTPRVLALRGSADPTRTK
jgi:hypothetical protein